MSEIGLSETGTSERATSDGFLGETRRLHPLTLLLAVVRLGPRSLNFIPAIIALGATGRAEYIVPALAAFILISLAFSWLAWTRFTWTVDADDVSISSGIISRQQRVIPFDRIQDVSIEQGLVQRLLGLAKVGFETGSSGGDKNDEAKLDAILLGDAEALRRHIRGHRADGSESAAVAEDQAIAVAPAERAEGRTIFAMSIPRLVAAGLFNFSLAIFAVLFGILSQFDELLPFDPFDFDLYIDLARSLGLEQWVLAHRWLSFVGGGIAVLLLGALTGIIRTFVRDYGFTLGRTERGFRRRRGLTTKTDVTIPVARVQAAMLSTGFIRRIFGWYDVKLQSLGGDGKNESDHLVAPLAKIAEADGILTELGLDRAGLEDSRAAPADWHRSHPLAMLFVPVVILIVAALLFAVIAVLPTSFLAEIDLPFDPRLIPLAPASGAIVVLFFGWLDWRHRRWHFDGRLLHIADGFLNRRHIILPARNIQSADLSVGPVARRFALADLELGVPGGKAGQHMVSAISETEARGLRAALLAAR